MLLTLNRLTSRTRDSGRFEFNESGLTIRSSIEHLFLVLDLPSLKI